MNFEQVLLAIENELYELVGKIDYGEISDIEAYWSSLIIAIEKLSEFGFTVKKEQYSIAEALEPFLSYMDEDLIHIGQEMQEICEGGGSSDAIEEDDIENLQDLAVKFERCFLLFIEKLRTNHEQ